MNKHVNKNKPARKKVDYRPTPVIITSAAVSNAELRQAMKEVEPGSVNVLDPEPRPARSPGLRERILTAQTLDEVSELLTIGAAFTNASRKTQRRWERAAKIRSMDLGNTLRAVAA